MAPVSGLAKALVSFFLGLYFLLLLGIALTPELLTRYLLPGITVGYGLVLAIHILPVIAAWYYLARKYPHKTNSDHANDQDVVS